MDVNGLLGLGAARMKPVGPTQLAGHIENPEIDRSVAKQLHRHQYPHLSL